MKRGSSMIKYSIKLLKRRPIMNMIMFFLFACITLLIIFISSRFSSYFVITDAFKNICKSNCYMISIDDNYSIYIKDEITSAYNKSDNEKEKAEKSYKKGEISQEEYNDKITQINKTRKDELAKLDSMLSVDFSKIPYVSNKFATYATNITDNESESHLVYMLNKDYSDNIKFRLKSGKWLNDVKSNDEYINVVTTSKSTYKVGDILNYCYFNSKEGDNPIDDDTGKSLYKFRVLSNVKCRVVGIIDNSYYSDVKVSPDNDHLDFKSMLSYDDGVLYALYPDNIDIPLYKDLDASTDSDSTMVKLNDDLTTAQRDEFTKAATENKLRIHELKTQYDNTVSKENKEFRNDIVFIAMAFLIGIVCLVGMTALSMSMEVKTFSILRMCGMTFKQSLGASAIYIFTLIFFSSAFAYLCKIIIQIKKYISYVNDIKQYEGNTDEIEPLSNYIHFSSYEIICTIILIVLAFSTAMLIPYNLMKKNKILDNIKEDLD